MPSFEKMTKDEIDQLSSTGDGERARVARAYDDYLREYNLNDYGKVTLAAGEEKQKLTIKNRIKAAAQRRGLGVKFLRTSGMMIRFQLVDPSKTQATNGAQDGDAEASTENGAEEPVEGGAEASAEGGAEDGAAGESAETEVKTSRRKKAAAS